MWGTGSIGQIVRTLLCTFILIYYYYMKLIRSKAFTCPLSSHYNKLDHWYSFLIDKINTMACQEMVAPANDMRSFDMRTSACLHQGCSNSESELKDIV